ncbi:MAG: ATP-dependent helicase [Bacteroidetes bacterium]|nr:ATP-dependent helicase [Bacteroidota bacterium]
MNRTELNQKFIEIYKNLNPEQQQAVDRTEGPVLVIAGPGTGKTQILSARIGKILLETDFLPDNILCLTYTDAGRVAMRKRLQTMIGADAYRVSIHTFHSFCNQIIQENMNVFEKNTLDPVSDLERISFIKEVIDNFKNDNPLRRYRGDVYYEISRLNELFSVMKREGWTRNYVKECTQRYIDSLPEMELYVYKNNGKNYKKGDIKQKALDEETQKMQLLMHAADAFDEFQNIMHNHHRYDFDDMINWVIKAFENNEYLLQNYQERFQYILVDEYQDTSGTQNQLVSLLCKNVEQPNLFVVGDDDQSIYRFQGANIENIENYKNTYADDLYRVVLSSNYRSTQAILDVSKSVIENNVERLAAKDPSINKFLLAKNEKRISSTIVPEIQVYENTFQELVGITEQVATLLEKGIAPEKIAILYKENKWGTELMKFFRTKQIPFYAKRKEDLFQLPLSKKILTLLRYISCEAKIPYSADDILFEILHFDLYAIPPFEIAKASVRVGDMKYEKKTSLRTYLQEWRNVKNPELFETKPHAGIVKLMSLLEKWISDSFNIPIIQLVENIMYEGGFLDYALHDEASKLWHLDILRAFMDFIKDEMHRKPQAGIANLIDVIELMEEQGIEIPLFRSFGTENGVNLLTAHGSKGLEFEHVFLLNTVRNVWEAKAKSNQNYKYPATLFRSSDHANPNAIIEEARRLFFVAITRAEEHLIISYSKRDEKEKALEPSRFIAEITEKHTYEIRQVKLNEATISNYLKIYLERDKQPVLPNAERDIITALLDRFEMNSTALNNYLDCPLKFYYQNLIRVPGGRSEASEFGSAVHFALERLFKKMKEENNTFPSCDDFIDYFTWYMHKHRESFTKEAYKRRIDYGHTILTALYEKNIDTWPKIVSIEQNIKNVVVAGVPLKGKLDKLEYDGKLVTIVDYKTGDPQKAKDKLKPPTAKEPLGGVYWRQGVFYKLLVDYQKTNDHKVLKTTFQFVEPDGSKQYISQDIIPSADDIATVTQQIKDTWMKIQQHDFYTGCGKANCVWCNFVKDTKQYIDLKVKEEIEVDSDDE